MERYEYDDWDGLGDPHVSLGNRDVWNWTKGTEKRKPCLGRTLALMKAKEHWPPLGLDGQPVENFKLYKMPERGLSYVQIDLSPSVEPIVKSDLEGGGGAERSTDGMSRPRMAQRTFIV